MTTLAIREKTVNYLQVADDKKRKRYMLWLKMKLTLPKTIGMNTL